MVRTFYHRRVGLSRDIFQGHHVVPGKPGRTARVRLDTDDLADEVLSEDVAGAEDLLECVQRFLRMYGKDAREFSGTYLDQVLWVVARLPDDRHGASKL